MALKYNGAQREEYLNMIGRVGNHWLDVFEGRPEFYSAIYWDLFTGMWLHNAPVKKTDVLGFMKAVKSPHTAAKYVDTAVRRGILIESDNPDDARSKLLTLSPEMKLRLDGFLDFARQAIEEHQEIIAIRQAELGHGIRFKEVVGDGRRVAEHRADHVREL